MILPSTDERHKAFLKDNSQYVCRVFFAELLRAIRRPSNVNRKKFEDSIMAFMTIMQGTEDHETVLYDALLYPKVEREFYPLANFLRNAPDEILGYVAETFEPDGMSKTRIHTYEHSVHRFLKQYEDDCVRQIQENRKRGILP